MTIPQYLAVGAALLLCVWPMLPGIVGQFAQGGTSYRDAIINLASIRSRLVATGALAEDQKRAIDVLTLALVDGSDK